MIWEKKKRKKENPSSKKQLPGNKTSRTGYFSQEMESGDFGVPSQSSETGNKMENGLKRD